jgi:hypothetical protein
MCGFRGFCYATQIVAVAVKKIYSEKLKSSALYFNNQCLETNSEFIQLRTNTQCLSVKIGPRFKYKFLHITEHFLERCLCHVHNNTYGFFPCDIFACASQSGQQAKDKSQPQQQANLPKYCFHKNSYLPQ